MSDVLYGPFNFDYESGRYFYHEEVGFGEVTLETPEWNISKDLGIVTVKLVDREEASIALPYGENHMPRHAFQEDTMIIDAVQRTLRGLS